MFEVLISKIHNLPVVKWASYLPDPVLTLVNCNPWDMSSNLPVFHPLPTLLGKVGHFHITSRAIINNVGVMANFMFNHVFYPNSRFVTAETKQA